MLLGAYTLGDGRLNLLSYMFNCGIAEKEFLTVCIDCWLCHARFLFMKRLLLCYLFGGWIGGYATGSTVLERIKVYISKEGILYQLLQDKWPNGSHWLSSDPGCGFNSSSELSKS